MNIIKPKKLKKGDTVGILAVSGRIKEYKNIEKAKEYFENRGYKVIVSDTCSSNHRYMAGKCDEECVKTLHKFFLDESIDAILCARGGYGTLRLLGNIDWNIIKNNPKIFAGYSDITILLNMIYKKTGLITFHSPMANGDFANDINEYTTQRFFNSLEGKILSYNSTGTTFFNGEANGILWGGNLSSLVSLCGIDFVPNEDLILFLEDLNEPIYKIDKMLTQLFNEKNITKNVKGIVLGEFQNIENKVELDELFYEFAQKHKIPMCDGFKITHGKIKDTIPVGANAYFDAKSQKISIENQYII